MAGIPPFWSSIPSWQLSGAILIVDLIATFFCLFGWFIGGNTSIVAVVRVWVYSFGVFCVMGGVYYLLQDSVAFDNFMHGKGMKKDAKQRSLEDFGMFIIILANCAQKLILSSRLITTCLNSTREDSINNKIKRKRNIVWKPSGLKRQFELVPVVDIAIEIRQRTMLQLAAARSVVCEVAAWVSHSGFDGFLFAPTATGWLGRPAPFDFGGDFTSADGVGLTGTGTTPTPMA